MSKRNRFFLAGILLFLVGIVFWCLDDGWRSYVSEKVLPIGKSTTDDQIRDMLLSRAPVGSTSQDVLRFVVDDLSPTGHIDAHYAYISSFEKTRNTKMWFVGTGIENEEGRRIRVTLGSYPSGFLLQTNVQAQWMFDDHGMLLDIRVYRLTIGP